MERAVKPLRILYAWDRLLPTTATDAEQAVSTLAALSRRGVDVTVLLPRPVGGPGPTSLEIAQAFKVDTDLSVKHVAVPLASTLLVRKAWFAAHIAAGGALPEHDVVYTRNSAVFFALVLRREPVVYDTHRAWPDHVPALAPLFRTAMRRPEFVGAVFHSEYARKSYLRLGVDSERLATVRNGFEPGRFRNDSVDGSAPSAREALGLPLDRKLVVYTGHISMMKGLGSVLDLAATCPDALFLLVGSEGDGSVERAARSHDNVRVLPWQSYDRAALYMMSADVLLLPPSNVGLKVAGHTVLPMKLYGYLAAGRAVLAPSTPDVEELLTHDVNALLCTPGDKRAATSALRSLLDDDAQRDRLAAAARNTGLSLTWDARAEALEGFIRRRLVTRHP